MSDSCWESEFEIHLSQNSFLHSQQLMLAIRPGSVLDKFVEILRIYFLIFGGNEESSDGHKLKVGGGYIAKFKEDSIK